uniref:Uncharacterized protein n=1 Tax=Arundo donax TaxID=35708 RepID=A0A0A9C7I2_ARUDO
MRSKSARMRRLVPPTTFSRYRETSSGGRRKQSVLTTTKDCSSMGLWAIRGEHSLVLCSTSFLWVPAVRRVSAAGPPLAFPL